jgi:hypothetical protein
MSNATRCAGSASRTQVGDLRLDLGELVRRTDLQARVRAVVVVVVVSTGLQQVSDFIEGEPQPLRRLDHLQHGDRLRRIHPVAAETEQGRHFAAFEQSEIFVREVRDGIRAIGR